MHLGVGTYSIGFNVHLPAKGYASPYDATFAGSIAGTSAAWTACSWCGAMSPSPNPPSSEPEKNCPLKTLIFPD
jgi:hypothetical protein